MILYPIVAANSLPLGGTRPNASQDGGSMLRIKLACKIACLLSLCPGAEILADSYGEHRGSLAASVLSRWNNRSFAILVWPNAAWSCRHVYADQ